ncbi:hypothetical protein B0H10DRAFT_1954745 [Mycena sp. CBHHK59/15]|nr:hypothetical protein B0H10DRAFT_1954745 [Mycena sp. CBHHK59/15]
MWGLGAGGRYVAGLRVHLALRAKLFSRAGKAGTHSRSTSQNEMNAESGLEEGECAGMLWIGYTDTADRSKVEEDEGKRTAKDAVHPPAHSNSNSTPPSPSPPLPRPPLRGRAQAQKRPDARTALPLISSPTGTRPPQQQRSFAREASPIICRLAPVSVLGLRDNDSSPPPPPPPKLERRNIRGGYPCACACGEAACAGGRYTCCCWYPGGEARERGGDGCILTSTRSVPCSPLPSSLASLPSLPPLPSPCPPGYPDEAGYEAEGRTAQGPPRARRRAPWEWRACAERFFGRPLLLSSLLRPGPASCTWRPTSADGDTGEWLRRAWYRRSGCCVAWEVEAWLANEVDADVDVDVEPEPELLEVVPKDAEPEPLPNDAGPLLNGGGAGGWECGEKGIVEWLNVGGRGCACERATAGGEGTWRRCTSASSASTRARSAACSAWGTYFSVLRGGGVSWLVVIGEGREKGEKGKGRKQ